MCARHSLRCCELLNEWLESANNGRKCRKQAHCHGCRESEIVSVGQKDYEKRMLKNLRVTAERIVLLLAGFALASCATPGRRIDEIAANAQLTRAIVQGTRFHHVTYVRDTADDATLTVYIEGDGIPWIRGREPAPDPTTREPLALALMVASPDAGLYVARPCYQLQLEATCRPELWTFARYGDEVVASMVSAIARQLETRRAQSVRLVGYSGGGVLAVLIAERLERVTHVITIAANLDVAAWSSHHGYLPLADSLDPARSERSHAFREMHLQGALDRTVPSATTRDYFTRYPQAQQRTFVEFDHVCCWVREWPRIAAELRNAGF